MAAIVLEKMGHRKCLLYVLAAKLLILSIFATKTIVSSCFRRRPRSFLYFYCPGNRAETARTSSNGVLLVILYLPDAVLNGWLASIVSSKPVAMALAPNHRIR